MRRKIPPWGINNLNFQNEKISHQIFQNRKKLDRFSGLFLLPKIGKIKGGEFSNFTNRITTISQTELQTEKHHQSTEFSQFPNNVKMQFNEQKYKQITNRITIKLQTERKKKRKRKKEAKKE